MAKIQMTVDGNTAAAYVAYAFTEVASIYPITPSSGMAESMDEWAANGRENIFGQTVNVVEMQSEAGASGAFHGSLQGGALTSTFTASQGLLLMIPNLYKTAGELLPGVIHVSARAIATHALSIFGDHQDVMACRQTGCAMLAAGSVQEVADLAPVAHLAAIKGRLPFINFFDGFRTSHEVQKIELLEYRDYGELLDKDMVRAFKKRALSPNKPCFRGTAQNSDIYFQGREASNPFYDDIIPIVEEYMNKIGKQTGRTYHLFDYYGDPNAEYVVVAMGSVTEAIEQTIDYYNKQGEKYGLIKVHLYRPFSVEHLLEAIPKTVKKIAVLDRTKEPGAVGEPLYVDICSAYKDVSSPPMIVGGRYGLASKDTTPNQIAAVYDNLKQGQPKNSFTIGIIDDITKTSLSSVDNIDTEAEDMNACQLWGLGSDGTVGANKQAIKIVGNNSDLNVQAYFDYDSKKSGGLTVSHLRFSNQPIRSTYLVNNANYVACHNPSYVYKYDMLESLKAGGIFVLNTKWSDEELDKNLPSKMKQKLAKKNASFYTINAMKIAEEIGLGNRINMIMQGAFFKLTKLLPDEMFVKELKDGITAMYGKKGEKIVKMNHDAVDQGIQSIHEVKIPEDWKDCVDAIKDNIQEPDFVKDIMRPMSEMKGGELPVSAFSDIEGVSFKDDLVYGRSFKDSQFNPPLIEFSGACAGCGETPYIKLITQLFGDRMMIANATGCSSIWASSAPSTAYSVNHKGKGPSWANSLFEDNAEYGYGMYLAVKQIRNKIEENIRKLNGMNVEEKIKEAFHDWLHYKEEEESKEAGEKILQVLKDFISTDIEIMNLVDDIKQNADYLTKRSIWLVGGDGWAYDIGYGGLDHVLASGEDVNVLVFDTEVYSNTGGQASKSTPTAAVAKFAASGKKQGKKDLGRMMMTYGNVYVAQVGINADNNQLIKALREAESYKGPSLIICYSPCINHGIKEGMGRSMANIKNAVSQLKASVTL